jgi:hypothetical protein
MRDKIVQIDKSLATPVTYIERILDDNYSQTE